MVRLSPPLAVATHAIGSAASCVAPLCALIRRHIDYAATIVQLFEQTAAAHPAALALEHGLRRMSYAELNATADLWARRLVERGVGPERLVGVCFDRSCEAIVALLAVLKACGAFVPLDPQSPRQRLEFMLRDAAAELVLTNSTLAPLLPIDPARVLCCDLEQFAVERQSAAPLPSHPALDSLAYAIFTSGSTGRPKAALLAHRGLALMAQTLAEPFGVSFGVRSLQFASLSFDAAVCEIFVALASGATLCLADQAQLTPGPRLIETLESLAIEQAILPPSVLALCPYRELPRLKTLVVAGETCSSRVASQWSIGRRFINAYGPTEATVCATWHECRQGHQPAPPIGRLLPYFKAFVLSEHGQPVSDGTDGELYLSGPALARGYLNRPELTTERFPILAECDGAASQDSFAAGTRVYKTGDIVRRNDRGELDFVRRADTQIKLRGVRIEPQEVQTVLEENPDVAAAYVDCAKNELGRLQLVAYVVAAEDGHSVESLSALTAKLRNSVRARLPVAMLPTEIIVVPKLPLSLSGKVDVATLRTLRAQRRREAQRFAATRAPSTPAQKRVLNVWDSIFSGRPAGARPIGIDNDFFALGGDSLKAFDLLARLEAVFGRRLQLSELIQRPTVEKLAELLEHTSTTDKAPGEWSPLVTLKREGSRPPLFLMSPGGGNVLCYRALVQALGEDHPVYGLQAPGVDGVRAPATSISAVAAEYLAAIRAVQPRGPYALGGWSFGGVVAYEMARQLLAAGEHLTMLALIESGIARSFAVVRDSIPTDVAPSFRLSAGDPNTMFARFRQQGPGWGVIPENADEAQAAQIYRVFSANVQALLDYRPEPFHGQVLLLLGKDEMGAKRHDPEREWARTCPNLSVRRLPGAHFSLLKPPHVLGLAGELRAALLATSAEPPQVAAPLAAACTSPSEFGHDCIASDVPSLL